jgi:RHS repeat-associated protein
MVGTTTTVISYQCDRLNRLLTSTSTAPGGPVQITSYGYDLNGNQTTQSIPGFPPLAMQWDVHNRLVGGNALGVTAGAAARYDYRTRRQSKAAGSQVTFFRYDQGDAFQELRASAMQVEFVRGSGMGGGIGSILYSDRTMAGGSEETFTYNGSVGHVVALTNGIGATTETNRFDAFGNVIATTGSSRNNRLANTKERDISIPGVFTLDNHGFRYYNAEIGRYISRDPIGYRGGPNVYVYVRNNPVNFIDPVGLKIRVDGDTEKEKAKEARDKVRALQSERIELDPGKKGYEKESAVLERKIKNADKAAEKAEGQWEKKKEFNERVWGQINALKEKSPLAAQIIGAIEADEQEIRIRQGKNPEGGKGSEYDGKGSVFLDSDSKREKDLLAAWNQPAQAILLHELVHAMDHLAGNAVPYMVDGRVNAGSRYKHGWMPGRTGNEGLSLSEARAVFAQNQAAKDLDKGAGVRSYYHNPADVYPAALLGTALGGIADLDRVLPPKP